MPLSPEELMIVQDVGFDRDVCERIKHCTNKLLERLVISDSEGRRPQRGISIAVADGEEAERLMSALRPELAPQGYRAYWSNRDTPHGVEGTDEIAILKTNDPDALIRLLETNGANYDIFTEDILDRLAAWRQICEFDVVGVSRDWVALTFSRLPEKICSFAEEIYQFCPDSVEQGVGLTREQDAPELFEAARRLCPEISPKIRQQEEEGLSEAVHFNPDMADQIQDLLSKVPSGYPSAEMGVRLLAHQIQQQKYLFLWWD